MKNVILLFCLIITLTQANEILTKIESGEAITITEARQVVEFFKTNKPSGEYKNIQNLNDIIKQWLGGEL